MRSRPFSGRIFYCTIFNAISILYLDLCGYGIGDLLIIESWRLQVRAADVVTPVRSREVFVEVELHHNGYVNQLVIKTPHIIFYDLWKSA